MQSTLEKPEERTGFRHHPLLPWIQANRVQLVLCALTVLRAYTASGTRSAIRWGSFDAWADLVAGAIVFAGGADVLEARPSEEAGDDGTRGARLAILTHWPRLDSTGTGLTIKTAIGLLYPLSREHQAPDGFNDLREALETLVPTRAGSSPDAASVGRAFRALKDRVIGGHRLTDAGTAQGGSVRWAVV